MKVVFINYALETFTPTQSGALATIIRECCLAARSEGFDPIVVTGETAAERYVDVPTVLVKPPRTPRGQLETMLLRAERKLLGYRHMGHRAYVQGVIAALSRTGLSNAPMIIQNDPELAVKVRSAFPKARIVHWFQNQHGAKPHFRAAFGKAPNAVAAVSSFTARWIESHYGLPAGTVVTVHNGVNLAEYSPATEAVEGEPVINFVGRTGIEKAPDIFLKAALELAKETNAFSVQMLGSNHWDRFEIDDYQRELSSLAEQLEQRGIKVRRPGHVGREALPAELRRASIHVVPSRWEEPCALTLFEGMASGLATVASRTGGTPEVVGEAGLLFERDNISQLAGHLRDLVLNVSKRRERAVMARERAEKLSWERTWTGLRKLIA